MHPRQVDFVRKPLAKGSRKKAKEVTAGLLTVRRKPHAPFQAGRVVRKWTPTKMALPVFWELLCIVFGEEFRVLHPYILEVP